MPGLPDRNDAGVALEHDASRFAESRWHIRFAPMRFRQRQKRTGLGCEDRAINVARRLRRDPVNGAHRAYDKPAMNAKLLPAYPAATEHHRIAHAPWIRDAKVGLAIDPGNEERHR